MQLQQPPPVGYFFCYMRSPVFFLSIFQGLFIYIMPAAFLWVGLYRSTLLTYYDFRHNILFMTVFYWDIWQICQYSGSLAYYCINQNIMRTKQSAPIPLIWLGISRPMQSLAMPCLAGAASYFIRTILIMICRKHDRQSEQTMNKSSISKLQKII